MKAFAKNEIFTSLKFKSCLLEAEQLQNMRNLLLEILLFKLGYISSLSFVNRGVAVEVKYWKTTMLRKTHSLLTSVVKMSIVFIVNLKIFAKYAKNRVFWQ